MAALKGNSLLSDIKNKADDVMDRVLGPSFDYSQSIKKPEDLGVSDEGSMGQVFTNANAVKSYTQQLITGPLLGNTTFVETGGMCKAPNGSVIPRWSFIDNRMRGADALPASMQKALGSSGDMFDGIIPGMMGDVVALNPLKPINGLMLNGVPDCRAISCPITTKQGIESGWDTKFVTEDLEVNLGKCKVASDETETDLSNTEIEKINAKKKEKNGFDNQFDEGFNARPYKLIAPTDLTPYVYWGVAIVLLFGVIIKKL